MIICHWLFLDFAFSFIIVLVRVALVYQFITRHFTQDRHKSSYTDCTSTHQLYTRLTPAYRLTIGLVFTHSIYITSPSYSFYGKRLSGKRLSGKVLIREMSVNPSNWLHGESASNNWSANNTVKQSTDDIRSVFVTMLTTVRLSCWNLDLLSQTHAQCELLQISSRCEHKQVTRTRTVQLFWHTASNVTNVEVTQRYQQLCYSTGYFLWV